MKDNFYANIVRWCLFCSFVFAWTISWSIKSKATSRAQTLRFCTNWPWTSKKLQLPWKLLHIRRNNCSLELCNVVTDILINIYLLKKNFKWRIEWMAHIWINIKSEMFSLMFHTGYEGKKTLQKKNHLLTSFMPAWNTTEIILLFKYSPRTNHAEL